MLELADQAVSPRQAAGDLPDERDDPTAARIADLEAEIASLGWEIAAQLEHLQLGDDAGRLAFARLNLQRSDLRVDVATCVLAQALAAGDEQWINSSRQVLLFTGMVRASDRQKVARYEETPA
jgi:hypothetical protein